MQFDLVSFLIKFLWYLAVAYILIDRNGFFEMPCSRIMSFGIVCRHMIYGMQNPIRNLAPFYRAHALWQDSSFGLKVLRLHGFVCASSTLNHFGFRCRRR